MRGRGIRVFRFDGTGFRPWCWRGSVLGVLAVGFGWGGLAFRVLGLECWD